MDVYCNRTHGAYVQTKGSSIVFNFGDADPEFGKMQGKELQNTLGSVLAAFPVVVRTGKGYVEACHQDVNKGVMAARMIDLLQADGSQGDPSETFVFCVGDDSTDELMFSALNAKLGKGDPRLFTVTVGRKPSEASSYLDGHAEVVSLLELFCSIGFHSPGTTLGGGGMGGMGKRMGGMSRDVRGGVGSLNASCTDLASLG
tara:strand:- start:103 stop:705 length:603 start_codon:yes stop_codon:yes gene_type:complete